MKCKENDYRAEKGEEYIATYSRCKEMKMAHPRMVG